MASQLFEVINPSDKVLVAAEEELDACAATLALGVGKYGLRRCSNDETAMPVFLFGGAEEWWASKHPLVSFGDYIKARPLQIAAVFDSVFYGTPTEHAALEATLAHVPDESRPAARMAYNERMRTSMSNIGARAAHLAARLREIAAEKGGVIHGG